MLKRTLLAIGFLCAASPAFAQDRCADVLKDGTFRKESYRENDYFRQIIYSRFLSSTYESSNNDTALGFGATLGETVMGTATYSREAYNTKKQELQRTFLYRVDLSREIDVALATGDRDIVSAWKGCMRRGGGGLYARFEILSPREAFLKLEFLSAPGTSVTLENDINLPNGVIATSGAECLKTGRTITAATGCTVSISLPKATTTLPLALNTVSGTAMAYLPARIYLKSERKPYPFEANCALPKQPTKGEMDRCADRLWSYSKHGDVNMARTVTLSPGELAEGWTFEPSSADVQLVTIYRDSPSGMSSCRSIIKKADIFSFTYGYLNHTSTSGNDGNAEVWCRMEPTIMMTRKVWRPQGDDVQE